MRFNTPLAKILEPQTIVIDLGSGSKAEKRKQLGMVTVDQLDMPGVDIVADLNEGLTFLPDNSVDEIHSANVLEHIKNFEFLMKEIHRVLKPNGKKHLVVPHFSNPYHYSDPTHKNFFGYYTFFYFSDKQEKIKRKVPCFYFKEKFEILNIKLRFYSLVPFLRPVAKIFEWLVNLTNLTQELYEFYLSSFCPCYSIEVVLKPIK